MPTTAPVPRPSRSHAVLVALCASWAATASAQTTLRDPCDGDETGWAATQVDGVRVRKEGFDGRVKHAGAASRAAIWTVTLPEAMPRLSRPVPPSRVIEEVRLSLRVACDRPAAAALRIVFPHATDPATGGPAYNWLLGDWTAGRGDATRFAGDAVDWQELTAAPTPEALAGVRRAVLLKLDDPAADLTGAVVDRAGVVLRANEGPVLVRVDDLELGPLLPAGAGVVPVADAREVEPRVRLTGNQLRVDGRPFFPRIVQHRGTRPELLADAGVNVAVVADWADRDTLRSLARVGVAAAAEPPRPPPGASLAVFGPETAPILFWSLGQSLGGDRATLADTAARGREVRTADPLLDRPLIGDVRGAEFEFSRELDLLGVSRYRVQTACPTAAYADWLAAIKALRARPGEPLWTWVQAAPRVATVRWRAAAGRRPAVVEPEQIRTQVYAALAAGMKGVGYISGEPFDDATPDRRERRLAVRELNAELSLMEPWLAAGGGTEPVEARVAAPAAAARAAPSRSSNLLGRTAGRTATPPRAARPAGPPGRLSASLLHTGLNGDDLLLAVWHGEHDNFVPGQGAFAEVTVTIPGALPNDTAWRITGTGVGALRRETVAGGMRITVPEFDRTCAILITTDPTAAARLQRTASGGAAAAADTAVELASLKLDRTRAVDAALAERGVGVPSAESWLTRAGAHLGRARASLGGGDHADARVEAERARRACRVLQRAHWDRARARGSLGQPTASPHLTGFATLPDHEDLLADLGRAAGTGRTAVLLGDGPRPGAAVAANGDVPAGTPGDAAADPARGWTSFVRDERRVQVRADTNGSSVTLSAVPNTGVRPPALMPDRLLSAVSRPVPVRAGDLVVITGRVEVARPVSGHPDGVTLHESTLGEIGALRWTGREPRTTRDRWAPFRLVREVTEDTDLTVTLRLSGLGVARFRDLSVTTLTP